MSTLAGSVTATALTLRLNDSPLTTYPRTLILDATGDSELVLAYSTDLDGNVTVARGAFGTAAVSHADGVSVDLYDGSPTAAATVPTLAEVLAEGNDPGGSEIHAAADGAATGAYIALTPGDDGVQGGQATLSAGDHGASTGSQVVAGAAYQDGEAVVLATVAITTGGSTGDAGQVLVGGDGDYSGQILWQSLVTVQSPTPDTTYITPLVLADAGLYAWTGAAYTKIGDFPA